MNRIAKAFAGGKAFIPFVTAGDPSADKTVEYILEMEKAGADLIELGIPFSDPTAEGPVIQAANLRALRGGMTTDGAFGIVEKVRQSSQIPLVFLTYLNPVFHYGYEAFFARCEAAGVDGIIIPDLPYEEKDEVARVAEPHGVHVISLVAPTSEQRIQAIAGASILAAVKQATHVPAAVGFGINTPEQAEAIARIADGVIVGSAIVKLIEAHGDHAAQPVADYVRTMKAAVRRAET